MMDPQAVAAMYAANPGMRDTDKKRLTEAAQLHRVGVQIGRYAYHDLLDCADRIAAVEGRHPRDVWVEAGLP